MLASKGETEIAPGLGLLCKQSPNMRCARLFSSPGRILALISVASLLLPLASPGAAAQTSAPFGIRTAYVQLVDDVYLLNARLHLPLNERLRHALRDGVPLTLELGLEVTGTRRYWPDAGVASLRQLYQLQFHAVSDRYVVRNLNSGEQTSFPTLDAAAEQLAQISSLPVLDRALIERGRRYEFHLRVTLDVGDMPDALRVLMFWTDDWRRVSDWYTWPLLQ